MVYAEFKSRYNILAAQLVAKPRMIRQLLPLFSMSLDLKLKNSGLDIRRSSSVLVSYVRWRKLGKTESDLFLPGSSLVPEERLPECSSKSFKIRSLPFMLAREPSETI